ncbi:hypothetical protein Lsed01_00181 [Demequina sediminis]|uniref:DUF3592 domain-containing protein n=1 Tax=Demequina sediminis TaxID=1930058 RepID=A0ABP9WGN8_9MICO|nr:hypothetical protein [Demequina sediminis]BDZ60863.1 hypothetical protein GCM10025873_06540 [Demequina sediminis]
MTEWFGENWQWVAQFLAIPLLVWLGARWAEWRRKRREVKWHIQLSRVVGELRVQVIATRVQPDLALNVRIEFSDGVTRTSMGGSTKPVMKPGDKISATARWERTTKKPHATLRWQERTDGTNRRQRVGLDMPVPREVTAAIATASGDLGA